MIRPSGAFWVQSRERKDTMGYHERDVTRRFRFDPAMISTEPDPGSEISCAGWETRSAVCDEHFVLVSRMVKYTSPTVVVPDVH